MSMNRAFLCCVSLLWLVFARARAESAEPPQEPQSSTEAQVDILQRKLAETETDARLREDYIDKVTTSLNKAHKGLSELMKKHDDLLRQYSELENQKDHAPVSQGDEMLGQIQALRDRLEVSRIEVENAHREANENKTRNASLVRLVETLRAELKERTDQVLALQVEVETLRAELVRRNEENVDLRTTVKDAFGWLLDEKTKGAKAITDANRVFYRAGSYAVLQKAGLIERIGFCGWSLAKTFRSDKLQPYSRYALREIQFNVPRWRLSLISVHADGSYEWVERADGTTLLRIRNLNRFWSTGTNLVVAADVTSPHRRRPRS